MSSNPEVSSRILPDGTRETVYQNGVRCVQNGNVSSWYYPGQPQWHYREAVSSRILPDGTEETVDLNGVRRVQNGNVWSLYYPGQPQLYYREVVNPVTGIDTFYTQEVDPNAAVSREELAPG